MIQANYWIIESDPAGNQEIIAGPIPCGNEDKLEAEMVRLLRRHPHDDDTHYQLLIIDAKGIPELEDIDGEWLGGLMNEAWDNTTEGDDLEYPIDEDDDGWPDDITEEEIDAIIDAEYITTVE